MNSAREQYGSLINRMVYLNNKMELSVMLIKRNLLGGAIYEIIQWHLFVQYA